MKSASLLLLLAAVLPWNLRAELVNVAGHGTPYTTAPLWGPGNWSIQRLVDGNRQSVFHLDTTPDLGAAYQLDLGQSHAVQEIWLHPRQDGCCPERLRQIRVSVHQDGGGVIGAEVWGTDLFMDGTNAGSTAGSVVKVVLPAPQTGRWVQVRSLADPVPDYALQMTELEVYAEVPASEVNRALNAVTRSSGPLFGGASPALLVDGNRGPGNAVHGTEDNTAPFFYEINLGTAVRLSRIVIWPRQDTCCPERLSNLRVSVHPDNGGQPGAAVWQASLFTDGSSPLTDPGTREILTAALDPAGTFEGQYIRVESLDDPVPWYALQISEVEAFGEFTGAASLLITRHPANVSSATGQTATFSVSASVPGGNPAAIAYQWQRDGADIPGATSASYTTPSLTLLDDRAKFRVIVSHPGLPSLTSEEATLRINLAFQAQAHANRPLWAPGGWNIQMLTDGNRAGVFHLDTEPEAGAAYEVDLGAPVRFDEIIIYPRQDGCCPDRLSNLRISIHNDAGGSIGTSVWSGEFFTDGTNPGASPGTVVRITAGAGSGTFEGQWIRILSLDDPVPNYALQMNELEAYGEFAVDVPVLSFLSEPADYGTAPGRTARFTAVARVLNGDPANIAYQWQKNGVDIPGATEASHTTPPVQEADAGAKYRVRISYPGVPSLLSREALLTFDYNYAKGQPASANRPLWPPGNWNIQMLTDGNRRGVFHLDQSYLPGAAYEVDLGGEVEIERIDIYPRQDGCCPDRFTNLRVSVHADHSGAAVWQADLFTDGTFPEAAAGTVVTLTEELHPGGTFKGRWVRITSLDEEPVTAYGLQMTELEVYGLLTGPIQPPVVIGFTRTGGELTLTWTTGLLEAAAVVSGPYEAVPNATSPHAVVIGAGQRYFRVRR